MRALLLAISAALPAGSTLAGSALAGSALAGTTDAPSAPPAAQADGWRFACDGTDPELLADIDEAFRSGVGYGETWDESICNQGLLILGEGVRLPKARPVPSAAAATDTTTTPAAAPPGAAPAPAGTAATTTTPTAPKTTSGVPLKTLDQQLEDQFFAVAIPVMTAAVGLFAVVIAALIGLLLRLRRQVVLDVGCPACAMQLPFVVGESPQRFCPACGAACRVDVVWSGKLARATAVPL